MIGESAKKSETSTPSISGSANLIRLGGRIIMRLPEPVSAAVPSRGQVAVEGTIGEYRFAGVLEPDGMRGHWLDLTGLPGVVNQTSVDFDLHRCAIWPEPHIPGDMKAALEGDSEAWAQWHDITPMARWEWVRWVGATKNPTTRTRRIEVTVPKLLSGKRRPCCFDLSSCTDPELSKSGKLFFPRITES